MLRWSPKAKKTMPPLCVSTLEYLIKGGRIGLVAGIVGTILDLKLEKAVEFAAGAKKYNITVMHGAAKEEADELLAVLKQRLPDFGYAIEGQITPALVVHTGPGLIGCGVQVLG